MKPLVTWLKVKRTSKTEVSLIEKLQNRVRTQIVYNKVPRPDMKSSLLTRLPHYFFCFFPGIWSHSHSDRRHIWANWTQLYEREVSQASEWWYLICMLSMLRSRLIHCTAVSASVLLRVMWIFPFGLTTRWNKFEEKWLRPILMKSSARKKQDQLFNVFHQLNLKDAMSYVTEVIFRLLHFGAFRDVP